MRIAMSVIPTTIPKSVLFIAFPIDKSIID